MEQTSGFLFWPLVVDFAWLTALLLFFRYFYRDYRALRAVQSWLTVKGRIKQFDLQKQGDCYWPKVSYCYVVNDNTFYGDNFFLDTRHHSPHSRHARQLACRLAKAYNKQQDIDVYYCPNAPHWAVLDKRIPSKLYFILCGLVGLIVFHVGFMVNQLAF